MVNDAKRRLILKHLQLARIRACAKPGHPPHCICNHESHIAGWDLAKAVTEQMLERGERLMQFIAKPTAQNPTPETGNYFTWCGGHGLGDVGIGSGLAGRTRNEFQVARPVQVLIGTASSMQKQAAQHGFWLAGAGGADQIFVADRGVSSLVPGNANLAHY